MNDMAPQKSNKKLYGILAIVLGVLVTVGSCCGLCTMAVVGIDQDITAQERELFITPAKLGESIGANFGEREELITYTKNWSMGITTLTMEYDSPEGDMPFYLNHEITYEPTVDDAHDTFVIGKIAMVQGMKLMFGDEVRFVDAQELYTCCDESFSQIISVPDEHGELLDVGHLFIMREGRVTTTILYTGVASHDPEQWRALLDPTFSAAVRARP